MLQSSPNGCVPSYYICDGWEDCVDASDEVAGAVTDCSEPVECVGSGVDDDATLAALGVNLGVSDCTSAVALAAALNAEQCEIYTDVQGIYSANPRLVKNSKLIKNISYEEMLEMASLGAKMHPRSIEIAAINSVKMKIKHAAREGDGTTLMKDNDLMEIRNAVTGIPTATGVSKITLNNINDEPGIAASIFSPLSAKGISVDVIVQTASSNRKTNLSFTVDDKDVNLCLNELKEKNMMRNLTSGLFRW